MIISNVVGQATNNGRVVFCTPDAIEAFLMPPQEAVQQTEKRIKGYRVSVSYESLNEAERMQKEQAVARILKQKNQG